MSNKNQLGILGVLSGDATAATVGGGFFAKGTKDAMKKPNVPNPDAKIIDESALAARKREIDRARGAGKAGSLFTRLGGSGSAGGMTIARASLEGGTTLG